MIMGFAIASLTFALIILSLTYSLEASVGFVAPLIPRTSPKHPLYNSNQTPKDIINKRQRISAERERFFAQKRLGLVPNQAVGPIDDELVMTYFIGTPPVETLAYPDTGSHLIWLQCQPCVKCFNQTKPIFDPNFSSSYQLVSCDSPSCNKDFGLQCHSRKIGCFYDILYADNDTSRGVIATDTFSLPETEYSSKFTHPNTIFGCGFSNDRHNEDITSGFVGLQNVSISLPGQIGARSFSYCKTEEGGYIRFGSASSLEGEKTKLFTDQFNTYQIVMLGIEVTKGTKTEKLEIDSKIFMYNNTSPDDTGVLVDSGTPYTRLNLIAFKALELKIQQLMKGKEHYRADGFELCYNSDDYSGPDSIKSMPSVHFILDNNVTIKFPNENIWSEKDIEGNICLQMFPSQSDMTIIGAEQLANYNVGFDLGGNFLWLDYQLGCVF